MNWLEYYRQKYYPLLTITNIPPGYGYQFAEGGPSLGPGIYNRCLGFDIMWRLLLNQRTGSFSIIETGTLREGNSWTDGQSAFLFTEFVKHHGGQVRSVDIDPAACDVARNFINSNQFSVTCSDSVTWLAQQKDLAEVDLFYLDSYDAVWNDDTPSAEHHLKEFLAIEPFLTPGTVVAVDDNSRWVNTNQRTGKGRRVVEYLEQKSIYPIYDEYQIIFQF